MAWRLTVHLDLTPDSWLDYEPGWLPAAAADVLADRLRETLAWEQRTVVLFGREVVSPRLIAWAGDRPYRYSGQTLEPRPFTPELAGVRARVVERTGVAFNHVLVNRYRDGRDSMGLHADDEPELGPDPLLAAVSLGASRRFSMVARRGRERRRLLLEHGSLLVMGGAFQRELRHGVPRQADAAGERINLTFRLLLRDPGR